MGQTSNSNQLNQTAILAGHSTSVWSRRIERVGRSKLMRRTQLIQLSNFSWTLLTKFSFSHEKFDVWPRPQAHTKGAFHLSELTGQTLLVVTRISLLIKTIQPDQSNPKYYARKRWFFNKNSWEKSISLSKSQLQRWSGRPVLTNGKRPKSRWNILWKLRNFLSS